MNDIVKILTLASALNIFLRNNNIFPLETTNILKNYTDLDVSVLSEIDENFNKEALNILETHLNINITNKDIFIKRSEKLSTYLLILNGLKENFGLQIFSLTQFSMDDLNFIYKDIKYKNYIVEEILKHYMTLYIEYFFGYDVAKHFVYYNPDYNNIDYNSFKNKIFNISYDFEKKLILMQRIRKKSKNTSLKKYEIKVVDLDEYQNLVLKQIKQSKYKIEFDYIYTIFGEEKFKEIIMSDLKEIKNIETKIKIIASYINVYINNISDRKKLEAFIYKLANTLSISDILILMKVSFTSSQKYNLQYTKDVKNINKDTFRRIPLIYIKNSYLAVISIFLFAIKLSQSDKNFEEFMKLYTQKNKRKLINKLIHLAKNFIQYNDDIYINKFINSNEGLFLNKTYINKFFKKFYTIVKRKHFYKKHTNKYKEAKYNLNFLNENTLINQDNGVLNSVIILLSEEFLLVLEKISKFKTPQFLLLTELFNIWAKDKTIRDLIKFYNYVIKIKYLLENFDKIKYSEKNDFLQKYLYILPYDIAVNNFNLKLLESISTNKHILNMLEKFLFTINFYINDKLLFLTEKYLEDNGYSNINLEQLNKEMEKIRVDETIKRYDIKAPTRVINTTSYNKNFTQFSYIKYSNNINLKDKILRLGIYWENIVNLSKDENYDRVDLDFSLMLYNDRGEHIKSISWNNNYYDYIKLSENEYQIIYAFSGDIVAPNPNAAEIIDIDLKMLREKYPNARFLVAGVNQFNRVDAVPYSFIMKILPDEDRNTRLHLNINYNERNKVVDLVYKEAYQKVKDEKNPNSELGNYIAEYLTSNNENILFIFNDILNNSYKEILLIDIIENKIYILDISGGGNLLYTSVKERMHKFKGLLHKSMISENNYSLFNFYDILTYINHKNKFKNFDNDKEVLYINSISDLIKLFQDISSIKFNAEF